MAGCTEVLLMRGYPIIAAAAASPVASTMVLTLIQLNPSRFARSTKIQNTFSHDLSALFADGQSVDLSGQSTSALAGAFAVTGNIKITLFNLLAMIAFAYCVVKVFFSNIKRGGILLIQMAVGALYMFSVPRGYTDGFNQWMKQVIAICLTAFMQTTLLFLGLLTFPGNMLLGLGVMLASNEVPRISQQFGLDSSVRVNMMSVVHATTTAVNLTRSVARAVK